MLQSIVSPLAVNYALDNVVEMEVPVIGKPLRLAIHMPVHSIPGKEVSASVPPVAPINCVQTF